LKKKTHFSVCEHNRHISVFYEKVRLPTGFYKKDPTQFIGRDIRNGGNEKRIWRSWEKTRKILLPKMGWCYFTLKCHPHQNVI